MTTSHVLKSTIKCLVIPIAFAALIPRYSSASNIDLSKLPPPSDRKDVTFQKDIQPLFKASCVRCHSGERPKAGLQLDTLEHVLKGSKDGKVVVPGESQKSQLVVAVSQLDPRSAMPPKPRHPFPGGPGSGASAQGGPNPGGPENTTPAHSPPTGASTNSPAGGPPKPTMPPPKPLTAEQVGLVRAWIDQGAK
jgi:hypothetical protein